MFHMMLMRAQSELGMAKERRNANFEDRAALLLAAALQLRLYFEQFSSMQSFQMTLLLKLEDTLEGDERVLKHRQHLKIVAPGCEALQTSDDKASFFFTNTPFWLFGDGSFSIERDAAPVQALLATEQDSNAERVAAYALALEMDQAFQRVRFDQYLGETL